jgi:hypothetical protein
MDLRHSNSHVGRYDTNDPPIFLSSTTSAYIVIGFGRSFRHSRLNHPVWQQHDEKDPLDCSFEPCLKSNEPVGTGVALNS